MMPRDRSLNDEVRRRILELYAEVDAAVAAAGPRCDASGRCCRFLEYGHTLFLSSLEAQILLEQPIPDDQPITEARCPYQVGNLCTARATRPLGCRIFFCDPGYQDTGAQLSEHFLRRLKALADEFGLDWHYAPLHRFLPSVSPSGNPPTSGSTKIPLTVATQPDYSAGKE